METLCVLGNDPRRARRDAKRRMPWFAPPSCSLASFADGSRLRRRENPPRNTKGRKQAYASPFVLLRALSRSQPGSIDKNSRTGYEGFEETQTKVYTPFVLLGVLRGYNPQRTIAETGAVCGVFSAICCANCIMNRAVATGRSRCGR